MKKRYLSPLWPMLAWIVLLTGCPAQELVTDPCEEECNDDAVVGAQCAAAEDCATDSFCNLAFPNGYCQEECEDGESTCGLNDSGSCVLVGNDQVTCVAACDPADPNSCGRPEAGCYPLPDASGGICDKRCVQDADCGGGLACDGIGLCRSPVATCDAMTNQGCPQGQNCYLSPSAGPFCGVSGGVRVGGGCANSASCEQGSWCVEGVCQELCDADDFYACGTNNPGSCKIVLRNSRLGVCTL